MDSESDSESQTVDYFIDIFEKNNRFGVYKENSSFKALSNFKIDFSYGVQNEDGPLSRYICTVTFSDGTTLGYVVTDNRCHHPHLYI